MKTILCGLFLITMPFIGMTAQKTNVRETDKLMVVWTSGDPDVALKVCFMYAHAAQRMEWFKEVTLIVWGPSAKLLTENEEVKNKLMQMKADGVVVEACVNCADMYGVSDQLRHLGIDVKGMGKPLTERLKAGWCQLNF